MKKIVVGLFLLSFSSFAEDICGSKVGMLNQFLTEFVIPDYFPPESPMLVELVEEIQVCEQTFGAAYLGEGCEVHDQCYSREGAQKSVCDQNLKEDWIATCEVTYDAGSNFLLKPLEFVCQKACVGFVTLMSKAQTFENGDFCPSCDAFNEAQSLLAV